jgi:hypothetical protein
MRDIEDLGSPIVVKVQDTKNYKSRSFTIRWKFAESTSDRMDSSFSAMFFVKTQRTPTQTDTTILFIRCH